MKIYIFVLVIGLVIGFLFNTINIDVINDDQLFPTLLEEINNADESIHLIVFEIDDNGPGVELIYALVNAKLRGVEVKIVTDGVLFDYKENYEYLTKLGFDVKSDTVNEVVHNKLIIIDSKRVIVGSSNWSYHSLVKNHESNVLIKSSSVAKEFEEYFQEVWDDY